MRQALAVFCLAVGLAAVVVASWPDAWAADKFMGIIEVDGGAPQNNKTTATPFPSSSEFPYGARLSIQCNNAVYVQTGRGSAALVDAGNGVKLAADVLFDVVLAANENRVAVLSTEEAFTTCKVFGLTP